jgi:hypothetical protein
MFTLWARNEMLAALAGSTWYFSAHTDYPGSTGANEVVGGSYARVGGTVNAPSAGSRQLNAAVDLSIPASTTVKWIAAWDSESPQNVLCVMPCGGTPNEFYVDVTADTFYVPSHGYSNGDTVVVYGVSAVPGGLVAGTLYYVVNKTTDTFQLSATNGGSAINITDHGSADNLLSKLTPEVFGGAGTLELSNSTTFSLNN